MKLYSVLLFAALCASCAEDDGGQTPGNSFREPVPETITLDDAVVTYYGDDSYSGVSDLWTLDLAQSSAGQRLVLSLNVTPNPAGVPDPGCWLERTACRPTRATCRPERTTPVT